MDYKLGRRMPLGVHQASLSITDALEYIVGEGGMFSTVVRLQGPPSSIPVAATILVGIGFKKICGEIHIT